jgi:hypothetical protein
MQNKILGEIKNEFDFNAFINLSFMKPINAKTFPENYEKSRTPKAFVDKLENELEAKRIRDRELIRDNIYLKYKLDIFQKPIIVFYEDSKAKKLKGFTKYNEADNFANSLLQKGIHSMLIEIMKYDIEGKLFKN